MGIIQNLFPCFCGQKYESKIKWKEQDDYIKKEWLTPYEIQFEQIKEKNDDNKDLIKEKKTKTKNITSLPEDEFLCPFCNLVPEILNINYDTGIITLECKSHKIIKRPINEYYDNLLKSTYPYTNFKCIKCGKKEKKYKGKINYCLKCQIFICEFCIDFHHLEDKPFCIQINKKLNTCNIHPNEELNSYCYDCNQNICKNDKNHSTHRKINTNTMKKDIDSYKKVLLKKTKSLFNILKFFRLITSSGKENIQKQVSGLIKKENERSEYYVDLAIYYLEMNKGKNTDTTLNVEQ